MYCSCIILCADSLQKIHPPHIKQTSDTQDSSRTAPRAMSEQSLKCHFSSLGRIAKNGHGHGTQLLLAVTLRSVQPDWMHPRETMQVAQFPAQAAQDLICKALTKETNKCATPHLKLFLVVKIILSSSGFTTRGVLFSYESQFLLCFPAQDPSGSSQHLPPKLT